MKYSVFNLNLMNTLFVIWKRNLWNGCVLSYLSFRYLRSKEQLMNVREMSSIHSAQTSLALWWIHKGCKNHFKTILDWCNFFVLHILCFRLLWYLLTKNVDSSIQYVIHDRKPRFENITIIHIYCTIWFCKAYFMYEKQFSCLTLMHFTMHIVITRSLYVWFLTPLLSRFIKTRV